MSKASHVVKEKSDCKFSLNLKPFLKISTNLSALFIETRLRFEEVCLTIEFSSFSSPISLLHVYISSSSYILQVP